VAEPRIGQGDSIGTVALDGDSLTLSWIHDSRAPRMILLGETCSTIERRTPLATSAAAPPSTRPAFQSATSSSSRTMRARQRAELKTWGSRAGEPRADAWFDGRCQGRPAVATSEQVPISALGSSSFAV
jgi:hypothetical protein